MNLDRREFYKFNLYTVKYNRMRWPQGINMIAKEVVAPLGSDISYEHEEVTRYFSTRIEAVNYCAQIGLSAVKDRLIRHNVIGAIENEVLKRSYEMNFQETDIKEDIAKLNDFTEEEIEEKEKEFCKHEDFTEYRPLGRACHDCKKFLFKKEEN